MESNTIVLLLITKTNPIVHFLNCLKKQEALYLFVLEFLTNYFSISKISTSKTKSDFAGKGP